MNRISAYLSLILLAGTAFGSRAQQTRMLSADKNTDYGIAYSLPQTALQVYVQGTVTETVPGPYYKYAERYLGKKDVNVAPSRVSDINSVDVLAYGVPGTQKYVMQLKPGALTQICVSEDGMLTGINTSAPVPELPQYAQADDTAAPDMDEYLRYVDADFLSSLSSARQAEMLAQTIMEIRDSRLSLSRGTAETMPADGRQLELMLQSLEQQENALTRAFLGYTHTRHFSRVYSCLPDSTDSDTRMVLCRLSNEAGLIDADSYAGEPLYISIGEAAEIEWPVDAKGAPKALPKDGVMYALPASAEVSLQWRGSTLYSKQFEFAQFGRIFALDPKLFTDKKNPSQATFDAVTGALTSIQTIK